MFTNDGSVLKPAICMALTGFGVVNRFGQQAWVTAVSYLIDSYNDGILKYEPLAVNYSSISFQNVLVKNIEENGIA